MKLKVVIVPPPGNFVHQGRDNTGFYSPTHPHSSTPQNLSKTYGDRFSIDELSNSVISPNISLIGQLASGPRAFCKFLHITDGEKTLLQICGEISERYSKLYPNDNPILIEKLQDANECDLDPDYLVQDVFDNDTTVRVITKKASHDLNSEVENDSKAQYNISNVSNPSGALLPMVHKRKVDPRYSLPSTAAETFRHKRVRQSSAGIWNFKAEPSLDGADINESYRGEGIKEATINNFLDERLDYDRGDSEFHFTSLASNGMNNKPKNVIDYLATSETRVPETTDQDTSMNDVSMIDVEGNEDLTLPPPNDDITPPTYGDPQKSGVSNKLQLTSFLESNGIVSELTGPYCSDIIPEEEAFVVPEVPSNYTPLPIDESTLLSFNEMALKRHRESMALLNKPVENTNRSGNEQMEEVIVSVELKKPTPIKKTTAKKAPTTKRVTKKEAAALAKSTLESQAEVAGMAETTPLIMPKLFEVPDAKNIVSKTSSSQKILEAKNEYTTGSATGSKEDVKNSTKKTRATRKPTLNKKPSMEVLANAVERVNIHAKNDITPPVIDKKSTVAKNTQAKMEPELIEKSKETLPENATVESANIVKKASVKKKTLVKKKAEKVNDVLEETTHASIPTLSSFTEVSPVNIENGKESNTKTAITALTLSDTAISPHKDSMVAENLKHVPLEQVHSSRLTAQNPSTSDDMNIETEETVITSPVNKTPTIQTEKQHLKSKIVEKIPEAKKDTTKINKDVPIVVGSEKPFPFSSTTAMDGPSKLLSRSERAAQRVISRDLLSSQENTKSSQMDIDDYMKIGSSNINKDMTETPFLSQKAITDEGFPTLSQLADKVVSKDHRPTSAPTTSSRLNPIQNNIITPISSFINNSDTDSSSSSDDSSSDDGSDYDSDVSEPSKKPRVVNAPNGMLNSKNRRLSNTMNVSPGFVRRQSVSRANAAKPVTISTIAEVNYVTGEASQELSASQVIDTRPHHPAPFTESISMPIRPVTTNKAPTDSPFRSFGLSSLSALAMRGIPEVHEKLNSGSSSASVSSLGNGNKNPLSSRQSSVGVSNKNGAITSGSDDETDDESDDSDSESDSSDSNSDDSDVEKPVVGKRAGKDLLKQKRKKKGNAGFKGLLKDAAGVFMKG